jgi:hypothetical protein
MSQYVTGCLSITYTAQCSVQSLEWESLKSECSLLVFDSFFSLPAPIQEVGYYDAQSHPG